MIEVIANQSDNILAFTAHGQVTGQDYELVLIPTVEAKLKGHRKIRLLYNLGDDFAGFEPKAMWDDLKVALQHPTAWEKVAMVSDTNWITRITKFCGLFVPFPVKVFPANEFAKATEWLKA